MLWRAEHSLPIALDLDGLFARPFFSYVDARGQFLKPFVLPQENPQFYDTCLKTFNVPELVQGPVTVPPGWLAQAVLKPQKVLQPKLEVQPTAPEAPASPAENGEASVYPQ